MALPKKPVTGMKDILPGEMEIRDYVQKAVREIYGKFGFTEIETPVVEHIENLTSNQGGENEKLIFRILKRGEKLNLETARNSSDLTDSGLRYDLTLPLSRYYAAHMNELPSPFKALQMGNVFRADRPQKGRFRQFMQCDIDILGDDSNLSEIELISATTTLLTHIGFEKFTVKISDRRILKAMAAYSGFPEEEYDKIFIILDKMDKIGIEGVREELLKAGYDKTNVEKYLKLFGSEKTGTDAIGELKETMKDHLPEGTAESLMSIVDCVNAVKTGNFSISFDPTLVRGMAYYTGTIFEITIDEFGSSIAGGGRYDGMVERFTGNKVPACGFSIGFERIITMLLDRGFKVPGKEKKAAFLIEKKITGERLNGIMKEAAEKRKEGYTVLCAKMMKNKKFQKDNLEAAGYTEIVEFFDK